VLPLSSCRCVVVVTRCRPTSLGKQSASADRPEKPMFAGFPDRRPQPVGYTLGYLRHGSIQPRPTGAASGLGAEALARRTRFRVASAILAARAGFPVALGVLGRVNRTDSPWPRSSARALTRVSPWSRRWPSIRADRAGARRSVRRRLHGLPRHQNQQDQNRRSPSSMLSTTPASRLRLDRLLRHQANEIAENRLGLLLCYFMGLGERGGHMLQGDGGRCESRRWAAR
jgi:hypothetical protein